MILAFAFHNYEHEEVQFVQIEKLSQILQKEIKDVLEEKRKKTEQAKFYVEKYDYNNFYNEVKKAFIKPVFPMSIDNILIIHEYDENDSTYSW